MTLGLPRLHLRLIDSTNVRARTLAAAGAPHGTLVTADQQTAGHGRQGRTWIAPARSGLLMSLVLRQPPRLLPLVAAVAVADVVGETAMIKWPNDILRDGRKVCGILTEGRPQEGWAVLGIGLNVALDLERLPTDLRDRAGTLGLGPGDVEAVLARLLRALDERLAQPAATVLGAWRERDALRGREIAWNGGRGVAAGIDGEGRLVVELPDGGMAALDAGEVHLEAATPDGVH